jgi:hypothetical protein
VSARLAGALLGLALGACNSTSILDFGLAFPRGESRLPAGTSSVRLHLGASEGDDASAPVAADGTFSLAVERPTTGLVAPASLDALDDSGKILAHGLTPPLPLDGVDDHFVFFMSAPDALVTLPTAYEQPTGGVVAVSLPYGVLLAGGLDGHGDAAADLRVYNAYDHAFQLGDPLPEGRIGMAAMLRGDGRVLLVGGVDAAGQDRGQVWLFNPSTPPAGHTLVIGEDQRIARAHPVLSPLPDGRVLVSGGGKAPAIIDANVDDVVLTVTVPAAPPAAALDATIAIARQDGSVLLAGAAGSVLFVDGAFSASELPACADGAGVLAADGTVWLLGCGASGRDAAGLTTAGSLRTLVELLPEASAARAALRSGDRLLLTSDQGSLLITISDTLSIAATLPTATSYLAPSLALMPTGAFLIAPGSPSTADLELLQ